MKADYQMQQTKGFIIGNQVLYDDNSKYHRKLKSKWVELQMIMGVLYNKLYKVADHEFSLSMTII